MWCIFGGKSKKRIKRTLEMPVQPKGPLWCVCRPHMASHVVLCSDTHRKFTTYDHMAGALCCHRVFSFFPEVNNWSWLIGNARDEKIEVGSPPAPRPDPSKLGVRHIDTDAFTRKKRRSFKKEKKCFPLAQSLVSGNEKNSRNHASRCRWKNESLSIF